MILIALKHKPSLMSDLLMSFGSMGTGLGSMPFFLPSKRLPDPVKAYSQGKTEYRLDLQCCGIFMEIHIGQCNTHSEPQVHVSIAVWIPFFLLQGNMRAQVL